MARPHNLTALKLIAIYRKRIEQGIEGPRLTPPLEAAGPVARPARPSEPIKEKPMSETKTELTDQLAQETYDELYIGKSLSINKCAEMLDVYPAELRAAFDGLKVRLRNRSEAQRAHKQRGLPWEWGDEVAQTGTSLAEDLGLVVPDNGREAYANGSPAAVAITDTLDAPLREGESVAFKIQDGQVFDVQRRPAAIVTAAGLEKFAAALTDTTLRFVLTDMRAEADPEVNTIRAFLGSELKRQEKNGK